MNGASYARVRRMNNPMPAAQPQAPRLTRGWRSGRGMHVRCRSQAGYLTLVVVLVVGAIGLAVAVALLLLGSSATRTALAVQQSAQARMFADSCAEEALQQIRSSTSFVGSGSLTFGADTCWYNVTNLSGQSRLITASSTVGTIVRKVRVNLDRINPQINVTSWQEVDGF